MEFRGSEALSISGVVSDMVRELLDSDKLGEMGVMGVTSEGPVSVGPVGPVSSSQFEFIFPVGPVGPVSEGPVSIGPVSSGGLTNDCGKHVCRDNGYNGDNS